MSAGTSTNGPTTPVKASGEFKPKVAIATAIANSKLFPEAVNATEAGLSYDAPIALVKKKLMKNMRVK